MTRPGHAARAEEVHAVQEALASEGIDVVLATSLVGPDVRLDGGDVMVAGDEIYVGMSSRTNTLGAAALRAAFPTHTVHEVPVSAGLHLKSIVTCPKVGVFVIADNPAGQAAKAAMSAVSAVAAAATWIAAPAAAANVLAVNGHVFVPTGYPELEAALAAATGYAVVSVANTEGAKVDGALTCCSLLVGAP